MGGHVDKRLIEVELVPVRWARPAVASVFQATFELREEAHGISEVQIGVRHISLQEITIVILWTLSPVVIVKVLVPLPNFPAETQIIIARLIQSNVLYEIENITRVLRV